MKPKETKEVFDIQYQDLKYKFLLAALCKSKSVMITFHRYGPRAVEYEIRGIDLELARKAKAFYGRAGDAVVIIHEGKVFVAVPSGGEEQYMMDLFAKYTGGKPSQARFTKEAHNW